MIQKLLVVLAFIGLATAQRATSMGSGQLYSGLHSMGIGAAVGQPDLARVILTVDSLFSQQQGSASLNQTQQQQPTAQLNQTQQPSGQLQPGQQQQQQLPQAQLNQTQQQPGQLQPQPAQQLPQQQQGAMGAGGRFGQQSQALQSVLSTSQQLLQNLQNQGALNVSLNSVETLPQMQDQPHFVGSILFLAPLNNLQSILQNAFSQGATGISSIHFTLSENAMAQATDQAVQLAIQDALRKSNLMQRTVGSMMQGGQAGQGTQAGQTGQVSQVRVLDLKIKKTMRSELYEAGLKTWNNILLSFQTGHLSRQRQAQYGSQGQAQYGSQGQQSSGSQGQQSFGQQMSTNLPTIVASVPVAIARVGVISGQQAQQSA